MSKLGDQFGQLVGEATPADSVMGKVTAALSALGPEGEAVALVLQVVTAAVTALVVTLYDWAKAAVQVSQEKDALSSTLAALSEGAAAAGESGLALVNAYSDVAATLPQGEGAVLSWTKALMAAGIQGVALERGVRAVAAAQALMGREGSAAAQMLIKRFAMTAEIGGKLKLDRRLLNSLAEAGVSAAALAAKLGVPSSKLATMQVDAAKLGDAFQTALAEKGGAALERMGLTWGSIYGKLSDAWEDLFEDMGEAVAPFMQEVKSLFAEFSAGTSAQSATKGVLTSILTNLFSLATRATKAIHFGFLYAQIGALKLAIAIAPIVNWFRRIYANAIVLQGLKVMLIALASPFIVIAGVIATVVTALIVLGTAAAAIVGAVIAGVGWLVGAAWDAASGFVSGLAGGITSGVGAVVDAVTNLSKKALGAFTGFFDINSPSGLMEDKGYQLPAGGARGVDAGAPMLAASVERMSGDAAGRFGGRSTSSSGGGLTITGGVHVHVDGGGKTWLEVTEEGLALVLERLAAKEGLTST